MQATRLSERDMNQKARPAKPRWYHVYFLAMLEHDRSKARPQIERARQAIRDREAELQYHSPHDPREMQDLNSASTYLCILLQHIGKESGNLLWD